jgi:hypothetical protein
MRFSLQFVEPLSMEYSIWAFQEKKHVRLHTIINHHRCGRKNEICVEIGQPEARRLLQLYHDRHDNGDQSAGENTYLLSKPEQREICEEYIAQCISVNTIPKGAHRFPVGI